MVVGEVIDSDGDDWRYLISEAGEDAVAWDASRAEAVDDVALEEAGGDETLLVELSPLPLSMALRNVL